MAFIPLVACAQSTDTKDYQIARKRLYIGTGDTAKYFTRISWLLDSTATHKHVPSARAVVDYVLGKQPLVYEVGLISPLPSQPVPAGSIALKTLDLNGNVAVYFSSGTAWTQGGEFPGIKNVDSLMLAHGEVKAVHLGQNNADVGEIMKWNGSAWSPASDNAGPPVDSIVAGLIASGATYRVDTFHTPGIHPWVKPEWATSVYAVVIGAGGGGSSGGHFSGTTLCRGGAGGASGSRSEKLFSASIITDTVQIYVGAGGIGGSPQLGVGFSGTVGTAGGNSIFGNYLVAIGGDSAVTNTGGLERAGLTSWGNAGGNNSTSGGVGSPGATASANAHYASAGGGGGGGISTSNVVSDGGSASLGINAAGISTTNKKNILFSTNISCLGGTGGGDGNTGGSDYANFLSAGGSGGAANMSANGGTGGRGGKFGGGGGGGGSTRSGTQSGAGGRGGDGFVAVYSFSSGVNVSPVGSDTGSTTYSTDGGGEIIIAHSLGIVPAVVTATYKGNNPYFVTITAKTSTDFTAKVWNNTGAAVTSTSVTIDWFAQ